MVKCDQIENSSNAQSTDYIIRETLYQNSNDTILFRRILSNSIVTELQHGTICYDEFYNTMQSIDSVETFNFDKINTDSLITSIKKSGYRDKFSSFREVMFIQIKPDVGSTNNDFFKYLRLRHKFESKIGRFLTTSRIGEHLAGDMGPGGANMLFFIDDWEIGIRGVLKILNEAGLSENVIIARRLSISINDWNYEVVFPYYFEGLFITG